MRSKIAYFAGAAVAALTVGASGARAAEADLVDTAVQEASDLDDEALRADVEAAAGPARDAVNAFAAWLRDELQPRATGTFRRGAERYAQ